MQKSNDKGVINAWCMYDWANSAFATTIMAAVLPIFYGQVAAAHLPANLATAYWGYTASIGMLLTAILAPVLGSIADYAGSKKKFLGVFALLGIIATSLLYFVRTGDWLLASAIYIVGEVGFGGSLIFYDSLLPHITTQDNIDYVSAKGYAMGYLGGGLLLAVNLAMIMLPPAALTNLMTRLSFVSVSLWWAIFSVPLFRRVPEPPRHTKGIGEGVNPIVAGFKRLSLTFHEMRKYRELLKFIVAFWLYNDGIGTIIKMAIKYGDEIGIGSSDLIGAMLLTQFVGIPFSLLFGKMGQRLGTKRSILLALGMYTLISMCGYFMSQAWHFWALAVMVGTVQGGSQALSRSLFSVMTPKAKSAEFFGFYDVSSKFAGIVGPAVFGIAGQLTGTGRMGILSLIIFFILGGALLLQVNETEGMQVAASENQADGLV